MSVEEFVSKINLILLEHDVPGQSIRIPYDDGYVNVKEYLFESREIYDRLSAFPPEACRKGLKQVLQIIYNVHRDMFGDIMAGPKHDYIGAAEKIHKLFSA